jgi:hypothetical protein
VVTLWGRQWTREELLARVGRLEQVAGIRLVESGDGAERGVRLLRCWSGARFDFDSWDRDECVLWAEGEVLQAALSGEQLLLRRPRHITWRQLGTVAYVVATEPSTNRDAGRFDARQRGELTHLAPGEARRYRLEIGGLVGHDAIDAFARGADDLARQVEAPA